MSACKMIINHLEKSTFHLTCRTVYLLAQTLSSSSLHCVCFCVIIVRDPPRNGLYRISEGSCCTCAHPLSLVSYEVELTYSSTHTPHCRFSQLAQKCIKCQHFKVFILYIYISIQSTFKRGLLNRNI